MRGQALAANHTRILRNFNNFCNFKELQGPRNVRLVEIW